MRLSHRCDSPCLAGDDWQPDQSISYLSRQFFTVYENRLADRGLPPMRIYIPTATHTVRHVSGFSHVCLLVEQLGQGHKSLIAFAAFLLGGFRWVIVNAFAGLHPIISLVDDLLYSAGHFRI